MKSSIMLVVTCLFAIFPQSLLAKTVKSDGWNTSSAAFSHSCTCCKGHMKNCACCSANHQDSKPEKIVFNSKRAEPVPACACHMQKEQHSENNALPISYHDNTELQETPCAPVLVSDVFANLNYTFTHENDRGFSPPQSSFFVPLRI